MAEEKIEEYHAGQTWKVGNINASCTCAERSLFNLAVINHPIDCSKIRR